MQKSSYTVILQFQNKFSQITKIQDLKALLRSFEADLSLEISSSNVWTVQYDLLSNELSGTIELYIQPKMSIGKERLEVRHPVCFRLENPSINLAELETKILEVIKTELFRLY